MKIRLMLIAGGLTAALNAGAELRVNEVMQSNVHGIMDDLNEFPDSWVELYNAGTADVDLSSYALSVKDKASKAYKLPARVVKPGEFVLVYCDKEGEGLHADFRVDSGNGAVYLWHDGELAETVSLSKMVAPDISWGRRSETSQTWGHQNAASPGAPNKGLCANGLLGDVVFSRDGGICSSPLTLTLSLPEGAPQDAVIRYTTDGSVPTGKSTAYSKPIKITGTTVVRATVMAKGYLSPLPATASYIFHGREQTLPIVSITTDAANLYDEKTGILVEGSYSSDKENFKYNWRRPVDIEYFGMDGRRVICQTGETRLKGSSSRTLPLKSMIIYANKRFGTKRFAHEFFPTQKPGVKAFKSLELRNSGQDFHSLYMRDALCQRAVGEHTDIDWQAWQPAIVYINGVYHGILNLRERANADNVESNYDGLEDVTLVENWWELSDGDMEQFTEFRSFYKQPGHTLAEYEERMDVGEFLTYMFAEAYFCNTDFPSNNLVMWRPMAEGGKWRWIFKDLDICLGFNPKSWDLAYLDWLHDPEFAPDLLHGNQPNATLLFRNLLQVEGVKDMFTDMCAVYLGDFLNLGRFYALMDSMQDEIADELPYHHKRHDVSWIDYKSVDAFAREWIKERHNFFYNHLADFNGLKRPVALSVSKGATEMSLEINGVPVSCESFDGKWFPGRRLCVTGKTADDTKEVTGWRVTVTDAKGEKTYVQPGAMFETDFPDVKSMELEPVIGISGIDAVTGEGDETMVEYYDLQGRCLGSRKPAGGIFLRKAGNKVTKVIL